MQDIHWHYHIIFVPYGKSRKCSSLFMAAWTFLILEKKMNWDAGVQARAAGNPSHLQMPPRTTETSNILQCRCLDNSEKSKDPLCLRNSMETRVRALSRNYMCPNFPHQGLTSPKCQQRPVTGLILGADGLMKHQGAGNGDTPWSKPVCGIVSSRCTQGIPLSLLLYSYMLVC